MTREYIVRKTDNKYLVLRLVKNNGNLVDIRTTDIFDSKFKAEKKAELGNYVVQKASQSFRELVAK